MEKGTMGMNKTQSDHLRSILRAVERDLQDKYIKGAEEHKTILSEDYTELELAHFMLEEALDQVTYCYTLIEKLKDGKKD